MSDAQPRLSYSKIAEHGGLRFGYRVERVCKDCGSVTCLCGDLICYNERLSPMSSCCTRRASMVDQPQKMLAMAGTQQCGDELADS